jgi:phospho-N-acetylmuramoyl-pentapeptide-transferase
MTLGEWLGGLAVALTDPTDGQRVGLAAATAFLLVLGFGGVVIRLFRRLGIVEACDKTDSEEIAQRHEGKRGTPTMGGLLLLAAGLIAVALWARWDAVLLPTLTGVTVAFGMVGALDDVIKIRHPTCKGLSRRGKMVLLGMIALGASAFVYADQVTSPTSLGVVVQIPFVGWTLPIGPAFMVLAIIVLTGSANAVNLTDGLDGLAPGLLVLALAAFTVLAQVAGAVQLAESYRVVYVAGAVEVAVFAAALAGAAAGFLVYNRHPARIFMGDTGALAMGGALGAIALVIRQELLLLFVGGVFVAEALSVILQVWYFRRYRRRILRCAPLHHHFEFKNWPESRITRSFWLAGAALSAAALLGTLGVG